MNNAIPTIQSPQAGPAQAFASLFSQLLEIENTLEILDYTMPREGFLLWPYIRYTFLEHCLEALFPGKFLISLDPENQSSHHKYRQFLKTAAHCFFPWPQKDIWLYSPVSSPFYKHWKGRHYNQYAEPFAETFLHSTLLLDASIGPEFIPPHQGYAMRRTLPLQLLCGKATRFMQAGKASQRIQALLQLMQARAQKLLHITLPASAITAMADTLLYNGKYAIAERYVYKRILSRKAPKLLLIHGAYYGGMGHLIGLAKEHGIEVADHQHGLIYANHLAYNWAPLLCASPVVQHETPSFFLTYGDYWNAAFRAPGQCVCVGNPWFARQATQQKPTEKQGILFALAGSYDDYVPYVQAAIAANPEQHVILRPHPRERAKIRASALAAVPHTHIDTNQDIYDTLQTVHTVIGDLSTSLFEAAGLGKNVFLRAEGSFNIMPHTLMRLFTTPEDLQNQLCALQTEPTPKNTTTVFDLNWKNNYVDFVTHVISSKEP